MLKALRAYIFAVFAYKLIRFAARYNSWQTLLILLSNICELLQENAFELAKEKLNNKIDCNVTCVKLSLGISHDN